MAVFPNKSLFALAVVGLSVLSAVNARECPNGAGRLFNGNCYKAVTTPATFQDAQGVCVDLGGWLPSMESEWANEWFKEEFAADNLLWIATPTGPNPYTNYAYGTDATSCQTMRRDGQHTGQSCNSINRFVCVKPLVAEPALCTDDNPTVTQFNAAEATSTVHVQGSKETIRTVIKNVPFQATVESATATDRPLCNSVLTRIVIPTGAYTNTHVLELDIGDKDKCAITEENGGTEMVKQSWVVGCDYLNFVFGEFLEPLHKDLVALNSRVVVRVDGQGSDTTFVVNPLDAGTTCEVDLSCSYTYPGGMTCTSTAQVVYPYVAWTHSITNFPEGVIHAMVSDGNPISCIEGSKCVDKREVFLRMGETDINTDVKFELGITQRRNVGSPTYFEASDKMYWRSEENNEPVGEPIVHIKTYINPSEDPEAEPHMRAETAGVTLDRLNYARIYVDIKYTDGSIVEARSFDGVTLVLGNDRYSHHLISQPVASTEGGFDGRSFIEIAFMPEDALLVGTDAHGDSYFEYQGLPGCLTAEVSNIVMESETLLRRMLNAVVWAADAVSQLLVGRKLSNDRAQNCCQSVGVVNATECAKTGCMRNGPAFNSLSPQALPSIDPSNPGSSSESSSSHLIIKQDTPDTTYVDTLLEYRIEVLVIVTLIAVGVVYARRRSRTTNTSSSPSSEEPALEMPTVDLEGDDIDGIEAGQTSI